MKISKLLQEIVNALNNVNAVPFLVGGAVRDHFLGLPFKDYDIEVFNCPMELLENVLSKFGKVSLVGKSFGVLKLSASGEDFDFSLPRKEVKIGKGHTGFEVVPDPFMLFGEASRRRDFTINAIGYNLITKEFNDPFGGLKDVQSNPVVLRVVDKDTFIEDPLRALRCIQFAARFNAVVDPETKAIVQNLSPFLKEIPKERVLTEIEKLLLKSEKPSIGFRLGKELGIIFEIWGELDMLDKIPQNPEYHPEGDVWEHTMQVIDYAAKLRTGDYEHDRRLMFSALLHDIGKVYTTTEHDGRIVSYEHDTKGGPIARDIMNKTLTNESTLLDDVEALIVNHMAPALFYAQNAKKGAIRRLSLRVNIPLLLELSQADYNGRGEVKGRYLAGDWLLENYQNLNLKEKSTLDPILKGRHLLEIGVSPNKEMGEILKEVFELQLDGTITDLESAINYVKQKRTE